MLTFTKKSSEEYLSNVTKCHTQQKYKFPKPQNCTGSKEILLKQSISVEYETESAEYSRVVQNVFIWSKSFMKMQYLSSHFFLATKWNSGQRHENSNSVFQEEYEMNFDKEWREEGELIKKYFI